VGGPIRFGRVSGFRGTGGEVTVRVASGNGDRWVGLRRVTAVPDAAPGGPVDLEVEAARAYGDRLVLKFRGVDDSNGAEALRGFWLEAPPEEVPPLPKGTYFVQGLIGARVTDETLGDLGVVEDVLETGGAELLQVRAEDGSEILIPFAEEIVRQVEPESGTIRTRVPEGLVDLNRTGGVPR
jgi:16S rRNA processing protein RimM